MSIIVCKYILYIFVAERQLFPLLHQERQIKNKSLIWSVKALLSVKEKRDQTSIAFFTKLHKSQLFFWREASNTVILL